jgi:hypothetical protein
VDYDVKTVAGIKRVLLRSYQSIPFFDWQLQVKLIINRVFVARIK